MDDTQMLPHVGPARPLLETSFSEKLERGSSALLVSVLKTHDVEFKVKLKKSTKVLVDRVCLQAEGGRILAILGPSGAGKSTLLDLIAGRKTPTDGYISLNGEKLRPDQIRSICSFVEQDDSLLGVLTVHETISYTLALHQPHLSKVDNHEQVDRIIKSLGLDGCRDQIIGTPIKRGISGGQRRRVSIACGVICFPKVLILDEPTSGLDSSTSREVMSALRNIATSLSTIIVCSIHQPGYGTWDVLDDCVLLGKGGRIHYSGSTSDLDEHVRLLGIPTRPYILPIDDAMDLLNTDFGITSEYTGTGASDKADAEAMRNLWIARSALRPGAGALVVALDTQRAGKGSADFVQNFAIALRRTAVLSRRLTLNYSRNLLAYGIRFSMYGGMAVMMSVIWVRLGYQATTINDRLSVHFYGVAFLSFMSVAGIPAFLEERALYRKERANGLYTPLPFVLANTLVNIPFLFGCCVLFSVIAYWGIGLHPGAGPFFRYLAFLFLAIVAAESQSVLVAAALPVFVAALAVAAFLNGFWMSVGGYFIKYVSLPRFWQVSFHWMDYQTYAFALLSHSDLTGLVFQCSDGSCPYPSPTAPATISGTNVLAALAMDNISYGKYAGILVAITVIYRIGLYMVLRFF